MLPFRENHLLSLLEEYSKQTLPIDLVISRYFRNHKALGSKDRAFIGEQAYAMLRWLILLDYPAVTSSWTDRWKKQKDFFPLSYLDDQSIPLPIRLGFPELLYHYIVKSHGEKQARELCLISNDVAPTTIRVNTLKTTRSYLLNLWKDRFEIEASRFAEDGIQFRKKIHFFSLPEFQSGLFEVQDEGSQLLSQLVKAEPGQLVMDYCAGSGGKTLAFAPKMKGKGQIFLHDLREKSLQEARIRLRRAGIQNCQTIKAESPQLKLLKQKMDWVLVDAPCTGTGTMRRNPDMKWRFTAELIPRLVGQQRMIFEKALSFLKPGGHIVYATCSFLKEENEEQLDHFLKTYDLQLVGDLFSVLPSSGGMDGFFGAVLKKVSVQ